MEKVAIQLPLFAVLQRVGQCMDQCQLLWPEQATSNTSQAWVDDSLIKSLETKYSNFARLKADLFALYRSQVVQNTCTISGFLVHRWLCGDDTRSDQIPEPYLDASSYHGLSGEVFLCFEKAQDQQSKQDERRMVVILGPHFSRIWMTGESPEEPRRILQWHHVEIRRERQVNGLHLQVNRSHWFCAFPHGCFKKHSEQKRM